MIDVEDDQQILHVTRGTENDQKHKEAKGEYDHEKNKK